MFSDLTIPTANVRYLISLSKNRHRSPAQGGEHFEQVLRQGGHKQDVKLCFLRSFCRSQGLRAVAHDWLIKSLKGNVLMKKNLDAIHETLRASSHPFRQTDSRPRKAQKHRYERRKIREFMKLGDWLESEPA